MSVTHGAILHKRFTALLWTVFICSLPIQTVASAEINEVKPIGEIVVYNDLALSRDNETVTIALASLTAIDSDDFSSLAIKDADNNSNVPYQLIDSDQDGATDSVIFQAQISANSSNRYQLYLTKNKAGKLADNIVSYSRFVPERNDDYAWENDKIAFRMFGPKARKLAETGKKGGLISSGIDCWLKRVEYPILNKWYQKYVDGRGDYHQDTGEGLDNYHVGSSLGCGGSGSLHQGNLLTAGNFNSHKTTDIGPIRTRFELDYLPWQTGRAKVTETKIISLDKGSNLTRYELIFDQDVDIVAGLSLDKHSIDLTTNEEIGVFSSWRQQQDSQLGLGIVADPKYVEGWQQTKVKGKGGKHLFVQLKSINKRIVYYAGFGWQKSQQFSSKDEWLQYLREFALKLKTPLRIEVQ
ncbi:DUF4861 family protein [Thalassotalea fonticola]|uniref:DUF4861 family protein n=1 Tax=Thalassotalea fonticola TaxID=3065649 RepID=A0ABZ0GIG4_9GAMM|nr:DUF4861 family protein [Colwelliaceae bacterium S1-1]